MNQQFQVGRLYKYHGPIQLFTGIWEVLKLTEEGVRLKDTSSGITIHIRKSRILKDFRLFAPGNIKWKTKYLGVVQ